ncbi:hypothetical protein [Aquihabitans sp. McL0605]|uniref:GHMP family kinase ATP-binding protein n=1 Tax=Aquihabitans sp. McL0605 TaxID=3415671 RepID=UPI003CE741A6
MLGRRVVATAPVRVADVGGWTDTWFGAPGRVCHLAVGPGVTVEASLVDADASQQATVLVDLPDVGSRYGISSGAIEPDHPIIDHAIWAVLGDGALPAGLSATVRVTAAVPAGASLGTSASVVVVVIAALDALVGGTRTPADVAVLAHQVEAERAGRESGVQDQWAAAMGGCGLLAIGAYPEARHEPVAVSAAALDELGERLVTVVFGPHDSSAVHAEVINAMVGCGGVEHDRARRALRRLASLAGGAAAALAEGDVDRWAEVLTASTEAQRSLHAGLIGPAHQAAIEVARSRGAAGWKVNGAGGDGGSLTIVTGRGPGATTAAELTAALLAVDPSWRIVDLVPSAVGVTVRRLD